MYDLSFYLSRSPIKLTARFKPRAEHDLLSRIVQNAWELKNQAIAAACSEHRVKEKIVELLLRLNPVEDMAVLTKYGQASKQDHISIRIYNPQTRLWDYNTLIKLDAPVVMPGHGREIYTCGPRFSEDSNYGVNPEYRAQMSAEKWQEVVDYHNRADAARLPKETEIFFTDLMAAQNAYKAEYRQATQWPAEVKASKGQWPTWGEIADQFPVVGSYIRSLTKDSD